MKNLIFFALSFLMIICNSSSSGQQNYTARDGIYSENQYVQSVQKTRKVVVLLQPQKFHLNSMGKTLISGVNKTSLLITLPENTTEWFYSICASKENSTNYTQLATQIGLLLFRPTIDISKIKVENGNSYCDIYLMDNENNRRFSNGEDFSYYVLGSRQNFNSGVFQMKKDDVSYYWLGIKNPRKAHAVDVTVEAVAIVEE